MGASEWGGINSHILISYSFAPIRLPQPFGFRPSFGLRISDFGFLSDFGLRISDLMNTASAEHRTRAIGDLTGPTLDLLIIGGGIVGAGIARDAAMRGLRVGLVEQHDFAFGTSGRSSRLLHGGMRYLAQGRLGLVREASVEKKIIHHIAPHLAEPLPFIFPTYKNNRHWVLWQLKLGVKIYDLLCSGRNFGRSEWLSPAQTLAQAPALNPDGLQGAVRYYDGFTNDARLTLDTLRSAARSGACVLNYCRFETAARPECGASERGEVADCRLQVAGSDTPSPAVPTCNPQPATCNSPSPHAALSAVWTCHLTDLLSGAKLQVLARSVVNATGPWADGLPHSAVKLRLTKGIHVVVERSRIPVPDTLVMTEGKRILFAIPWGQRIILGTTDTDYSGPLDQIHADAADIRYVLEVTNRFFPKASLSERDIISTWAGLRPLIAEANGKPSDISRAHQIRSPEPGWFDVAGGKLTTYRLMAEQTVDRVLKWLWDSGSSGGTFLINTPLQRGDRSPTEDPNRFSGFSRAEQSCQGGETAEAVEIPSASLATPLKRGVNERDSRKLNVSLKSRTAQEPLLPKAEAQGVSAILPPKFNRRVVEHYVAKEWALHLEDVMLRRTSWHYYCPDAASKAEQFADWMAELLGWSAETRATELATYRRLLSQQQTKKTKLPNGG